VALSNLDVVRRMLETFDGRDPERLIAWACEDIELRTAIIGGIEGNAYRGHDGVRAWARERDEMFDDIKFRFDEILEIGDLVVVLGSIHARGHTSGLVLDSPSGWVVSVSGERIATLHGYMGHDKALAAARARAS
jgi:ketosteroid isomerase-like protein